MLNVNPVVDGLSLWDVGFGGFVNPVTIGVRFQNIFSKVSFLKLLERFVDPRMEREQLNTGNIWNIASGLRTDRNQILDVARHLECWPEIRVVSNTQTLLWEWKIPANSRIQARERNKSQQLFQNVSSCAMVITN